MKKSEIFQAKVDEQPDNSLYRFSLAQALSEEGAASESVPHLRHCADLRADWMLPRILLGKALLQTDKAAEAKPILQAALTLAVEQHHEDPAEELRALLADL